MHTHANKHARSLVGTPKPGRRGRAAKWARVALVAAVPVLGTAATAAPAVAQVPDASSHYAFTTLDNQADPTFNQLLGINQHGLIAGYFGSGAAGHPNKGYLLSVPYGQSSYQNENWPESVQTQVTGLNDHGVSVGFWSSMNNANNVNDNRAFVSMHGSFIDGDFPTKNPANPPVDQLLGVNDHDMAVGFYVDGNGNTHAYRLNILRNRFSEVTPAGIANPTAAAINNPGTIVGFGTDRTHDSSNGQVVGYVLSRTGKVTVLDVPGSSMTQATGINDNGEVVGVYQVGHGSGATMYGFTWTGHRGFETITDPNGVGTTTVNGVNDQGDLVGFYVDAAGNTDGLLATPQHNG